MGNGMKFFSKRLDEVEVEQSPTIPERTAPQKMNQTTTTTPTDTHPVSDLNVFHLQLDDDGKFYCDNPKSKEAHERLLHMLQTNDSRDIITAAVDRDSLARAFVNAGARGHVDILELFLNHGMNIDITNASGWTALMEASYSKCEESVRFLLDHSASVDLQNNYGDTALMVATASGYKKAVEALLNHGADIELKNEDGKTALDLAHKKDIKNIIRNHVNTSYVLK